MYCLLCCILYTRHLKLPQLNQRALVLGEQGLVDELTEAGIDVVKPVTALTIMTHLSHDDDTSCNSDSSNNETKDAKTFPLLSTLSSMTLELLSHFLKDSNEKERKEREKIEMDPTMDRSSKRIKNEENIYPMERASLGQFFRRDPSIGAVIIGFNASIEYVAYVQAFAQLTTVNPLSSSEHDSPSTDRQSFNPCVFIATNDDPTLPLMSDVFPGTGSLVSVLTTALGRAPDVILGKPYSPMQYCVRQLLIQKEESQVQEITINGQNDVIEVSTALNPSRVCMVGDRLDSDIAFGKAGGYQTMLVLSGVTSRSQWTKIEQSRKEINGEPSLLEECWPDYCLESLKEIGDLLKETMVQIDEMTRELF